MKLKTDFLYVLSLNIGFIKSSETQKERGQRKCSAEQLQMLTASVTLLYYELFREDVKRY